MSMATPPPTAGMSSAEAAAYIRAVLDVTIRVTEALFAGGAGAEDTVAAMQAVSRAYGVKNVEADLTYSLITLSWENPATFETISHSRNVKYRTLDYARLTRATELISRIVDDPPPLEETRRTVAAIIGRKPMYPRWLRSIGWSLVGVGAALLLGGGPLVAAASFLATLVIDLITSALQRRRVPVFYQSLAGGCVGPIAAAGAVLVDPSVNPSLVVVAAIIMLLAGVTTFGAVHDTLSGFYVTGTARLVEAVLITAGLVAGVLASGLLLGRFGLDLKLDPATGPSLEDVPMQLVAAAVIVAGFCLAAQVPRRSIWGLCVLGAVAELAYSAGVGAGIGIVFASASAAVVVGLLAALAVRVVRVPPIVAVVASLVPLVPGRILFTGLMQLADSDLQGLLSVLAAAGVAGALAAGAILGQYLVQATMGPARSLQRRFVGPLMAISPRLARGRNRPRRR
ncbi:threonine/serine exporter family protein [Rathayibacter sp. YIM 133350]|uniref:threonine/serine ThrE exporter family protein n=1 Tax=Rathayibacter sp. YIM 133350 TaxID=3131992 RepID=UPI00307D1A93